jgi:acyl-coenzyme A thioesterase PaaI-like protein
MIPLGLSTYAYSSYVQTHKKKKTYLDTSHFSEHYTNFIKQNELVVPEFYHKLKRDNSINSFFFKSILRNVGGLDQFSIYMDKDLHSVVNKDMQVTEEERQKMFENSKLFCLFVANKKVEDAEDIVHAGFTATLLDNMAGTLAFLACGNKPVATASLTVNYRKPIKTGDEYLTEISTKKVDGNKVIVQGLIKDKEGTVFADADLMFVKVDWKNMVFANIIKNIEEKVLGKTEKEPNQSLSPHIYMNVPDIVIDFQTDTKRKFRIGERYAKFC